MTLEETTEKIKQYFLFWKYIVEGWGWKFAAHYCNGFEDMPDAADNDTVALTTTQWNYLEGNIYFNLRKIENYTDEEIESLVIHELCHFLVAPMQSNKNNSEITVTMIARILKGLNDSR